MQLGLLYCVPSLLKLMVELLKMKLLSLKKFLEFQKENMKDVGAIWNEAAQSSAGFEPYAEQLSATFRRSPQMLEQIILGLFEIGYADHDLSNPELRYIKKVSQIFGIDQQTFNRLRNSRPEFNKEDPYKVLGAKKSQSTTEIKKIYRNLARKNHPDSLRSSGITDPSLIKKAKENFQNINDAYQQILKMRGES